MTGDAPRPPRTRPPRTQYLLPFVSGPTADAIAAIFRLQQRFTIPLVTDAFKGKSPDDPRNWQPVDNPLLDQQVRARAGPRARPSGCSP